MQSNLTCSARANETFRGLHPQGDSRYKGTSVECAGHLIGWWSGAEEGRKEGRKEGRRKVKYQYVGQGQKYRSKSKVK